MLNLGPLIRDQYIGLDTKYRYLEILSYFPRYRLNSKAQNQAGLESLNLDVVQNVATGEIRKYGTWYTNYRVKEIITIILNQLNQIL